MAVRRLEIGAFGGPELIRVVEDAALPAPGPGEVRIRVEASSLVFTDMLIRRNLYPVLKLTLPLTLGYDLIGRIDGVGPGVTRWRLGDRGRASRRARRPADVLSGRGGEPVRHDRMGAAHRGDQG